MRQVRKPMMDRVKRSQRGRTLIELMVAMAIGLAISTVLMSVFLFTRQSSRVIDESAGMQDTARFAQYVLGRHLRHAGFTPVVDPTSPVPVTRWSDTGFGPHVFGCRNEFTSAIGDPAPVCDGGVGASDDIEVRTGRVLGANTYNGATGEGGDCLGNNPVGGVIASRFYVAPGPSGRNELFCRGNGAAAAQQIVDGVDQLVVWYGTDSTADQFQSVDNWSRADALVGAAWSNVTALRVCIVVRSLQRGVTSGAAYTYPDCFGQPTASPDGTLRRAYFMTVSLRNVVRAGLSRDI